MKPVFGTTLTRQVAFVGPFGVGKTTAVRTISDVEIVMTETKSSAAAHTYVGRHIKESTTVGLEYGEWLAPDGERVAVVGTPGQERFDTVRSSAMPRSTSVVLWLFGNHKEALLDCDLWLEFLSEEVSTAKFTVAITRLEENPEGLGLGDFRPVIDKHSHKIPMLAADPRDRDQVTQVLRRALKLEELTEGGRKR